MKDIISIEMLEDFVRSKMSKEAYYESRGITVGNFNRKFSDQFCALVYGEVIETRFTRVLECHDAHKHKRDEYIKAIEEYNKVYERCLLIKNANHSLKENVNNKINTRFVIWCDGAIKTIEIYNKYDFKA